MKTLVSVVIFGLLDVSPGINHAFSQTTTETYNQATRQYEQRQANWQKQQAQYQQQLADYQKQQAQYLQELADYQKQFDVYQQQAAIYQKQDEKKQADYDALTKMSQKDHQRLNMLILTQSIICLGFCVVLVWCWNQRSHKMSV
jgi:hypothetical protein